MLKQKMFHKKSTKKNKMSNILTYNESVKFLSFISSTILPMVYHSKFLSARALFIYSLTPSTFLSDFFE